MSNDFSRVFAMLRPVSRGFEECAGFMRMELQQGRGRATVSVLGVPVKDREGMHIVLVGGNDGAKVYDMGAAAFDKRGQGGLLHEFTPENIGGAPIGQYDSVAVIRDGAAGAEVIMAGVFGQRAAQSWGPAQERVFALWHPQRPQKPPGRDAREADEAEPSTIIYDPQDMREQGAEPERQTQTEPQAEPAKEQGETPLAEVPQTEAQAKAAGRSVYESPLQSLARRSLEELGGDVEAGSPDNDDVAWQGHAYTVRPLFDRYERAEPFAGAEGMRFVRVPMALRAGDADHYLLGAHERDGEVDVLCFGVPGSFRMTPPPGLEGYAWKEDASGRGYWINWLDAYTGHPVRFDLNDV